MVAVSSIQTLKEMPLLRCTLAGSARRTSTYGCQYTKDVSRYSRECQCHAFEKDYEVKANEGEISNIRLYLNLTGMKRD